jgi:hypothetical protein
MAADILKSEGIWISVLALWNNSWTILTHIVDGKREPLLDGSGNTIDGSVDLITLTEIVKRTGGKLKHISLWDEPFTLTSLLPETGEKKIANTHEIDEIFLALLFGIILTLYLMNATIIWHRYKSR